MCLAIIALNTLPDWPLIIVANRDELHERPTLAAKPWVDDEMILGGRDLNAGGTWLGMTAGGCIALLTNVREPGMHRPDAPSRGQLTETYLRSNAFAKEFVQSIEKHGQSYNGFNLFLGDQKEFWYCSNRGGMTAQKLDGGVVGISNASINTPWPKLMRTRNAVAAHLSHSKQPDPNHLFAMMQDRNPALKHELPDTGIGAEREKLLSSPFILDPRYGTRCSTLVMKRADGIVLFHEKRYNSEGRDDGESVWMIDTIQQKIETKSLSAMAPFINTPTTPLHAS